MGRHCWILTSCFKWYLNSNYSMNLDALQPLTVGFWFTTHVITDIKLSIFCYVALYLVVKMYSEGACSTFITTMILVIIPLQAVTGLLLFLGAVDIKLLPLKVAIWFSLLVAALNTALGVVGAIFFIRTGFNVLHFLIAGYFALLTLSFCSVLCHDIIITLTFIKLVDCPPALPPDEITTSPI